MYIYFVPNLIKFMVGTFCSSNLKNFGTNGEICVELPLRFNLHLRFD